MSIQFARHKKVKFHDEDINYTFSSRNAVADEHVTAKERTSMNVIDYSDVFALPRLFKDEGKYGSLTKDYELLHAQRMQVFNYMATLQKSSGSQMYSRACQVPPSNPDTGQVIDQNFNKSIYQDVIDLEEPKELQSTTGKDITSAIVVDSDDEDGSRPVQSMQPFNSDRLRDFRAWLGSQMELRLKTTRLSVGEGNSNHPISNDHGNAVVAIEGTILPSIQYEKVILSNVPGKQASPNLEYEKVILTNVPGKQASPNLEVQRLETVTAENEGGALVSGVIFQNKRPAVAKRGRKRKSLATEVNVEKETDLSSPTVLFEAAHDYSPSTDFHNQDDTETSESDGLEDLWQDMSVAMECSKGVAPSDESTLTEEEDECCHSFMLADDLGLVCRVCGVIQRRIETIIDYQWTKGNRTTRTYMPGSKNSDLGEVAECSGTKISEHFLTSADISVHPRHMKLMKPHQIEGFNFLVKNLLADPPGGCILAHAPGSGKTFMLISFIQSFMAKDPSARPLVVLPKGILGTWKKEFSRWQVEDIPIYDFYSSKADNRSQQLEILNSWQENRSILFLGYKQFANIICEGGGSKITSVCQEKLLKIPSLLILDEGHTPRNDNTDMVDSLAKVRTSCKVVLSGTLFQNHVGEVFNILKLVRPNFMKSESSRTKIKRILSRVNITGGRRPSKGNLESHFCELVEETLRMDENYTRKISVIKELRDMTRDVLHYYKGDFLDELPGLVDFTVLLNLGDKQKNVIRKLGKLDKFKKSSLEKAIYMHPQLMELRENASGDKDTSININKVDGIVDSMNIREGVKAKFFLNLLSMAESTKEKLLVFGQYLLPLKFLERLLVRVKGWRPGKEIFVISGDSSPEDREWSMDQFNNSPDAKVFFGSIKACGEGISLVGASRILILDVHINPSVTRQAIGRAFRPGQEKKVYTYRLVAADSQEEEDHHTSFRKELVSKMWFEWSEHFGHGDFELDVVDDVESQDIFFENPALGEDIKVVYKR